MGRENQTFPFWTVNQQNQSWLSSFQNAFHQNVCNKAFILKVCQGTPPPTHTHSHTPPTCLLMWVQQQQQRPVGQWTSWHLQPCEPESHSQRLLSYTTKYNPPCRSAAVHQDVWHFWRVFFLPVAVLCLSVLGCVGMDYSMKWASSSKHLRPPCLFLQVSSCSSASGPACRAGRSTCTPTTLWRGSRSTGTSSMPCRGTTPLGRRTTRTSSALWTWRSPAPMNITLDAGK